MCDCVLFCVCFLPSITFPPNFPKLYFSSFSLAKFTESSEKCVCTTLNLSFICAAYSTGFAMGCAETTVGCYMRKDGHLWFVFSLIKGVLHPRLVFGLFLHFSQKLQHIGNK